MDGTLTVPCIDFAEMRRRIGVPTGDVLETIATWQPERQQAARQAVWEIEEKALEIMQVMPGAIELCKFLDQCNIPRGLLTRNVKRSVDFFHKHHFPLPLFQPAISREFAMFKPSPVPLLHICDAWGISPQEAMMVGDSAKDDVVCGNRAGAVTVLLDTSGDFPELQDAEGRGDPEAETNPTWRVRSLSEVATLLQRHYQLLQPEGRVEGGGKVETGVRHAAEGGGPVVEGVR